MVISVPRLMVVSWTEGKEKELAYELADGATQCSCFGGGEYHLSSKKRNAKQKAADRDRIFNDLRETVLLDKIFTKDAP